MFREDPYYGLYGGYGGYGSYGGYPYSYRYDEAEVYLDGQYIGTADDFDGYPDYLYLEQGQYRLEFRLDGYETRTIDLQAQAGTKVGIDERLRKIPGAGMDRPSGRRDSDGSVQRFWGRSGGALRPSQESIETEGAYREDGPPGDRDLERDTSGREREGRSADSRSESDDLSGVGDGKTRLRLSAGPSDAAVYVDDRFIGTAEEVNSRRRGISISAGEHRVTVTRPGFKEKTVDLQVGEGKTEELEVSLSR